jgi:serine/threonine protein kinase
MGSDDPLDDILDAWQVAFERGADPPAAELCKDHPDLVPEVEQRVAALRQGLALAVGRPVGATDSTGNCSADTEPPPDRIGGYRVLGRLGAGGMGEVYRAEDPTLGRQVALKIMKPELATRPVSRSRFLREARAAAAVRHDHVVEIYHVGEDDGTAFLVMPLLDGESLEDRLKGGPLPPGEVVRVGREAALGLAAAHVKGIVHRDVKPANLWLEAPAGRVKVLDFGLARAADARDGLTSPGAVLGTAAYMAPEQVNGGAVDARSDLFALGAVLYRCATGKPAFSGPTLTAILRAVAEHDPPPPHEVDPTVPVALSRLIMGLLAKDPAGRPPSAAAVAVELATTASGPPPADHAPTAEYRPVRRHRWPVVVAAIVLLVGAGAAIWQATRDPDSGTEPNTPGGQPQAGPDSPENRESERPPVRYRGSVDVLVKRDGQWLRLNRPGALPLRRQDEFAIEAKVDPPAYLYVVWVDPEHDVTPVYPWDPTIGWGSRPAKEDPRDRLRPPETGPFRAPQAKPGVATMVVLARPTPLDSPDDEVRKWFEQLPELPLPPGGEGSAVWFDDYIEAKDPDRLRTFERVGGEDPFAKWQGQLRKAVGVKVAFQTAVSFARTGGN